MKCCLILGFFLQGATEVQSHEFSRMHVQFLVCQSDGHASTNTVSFQKVEE